MNKKIDKKKVAKKKEKTLFFDFQQNNSGGAFDFDAKRGISVNVIVEATDREQANNRAEEIGLYFDGAGDCSCCGNRWSEQGSWEKGDDKPLVYGRDVFGPFKDPNDEWPSRKWIKSAPEGFVHYLDGRVVPFWG